MSGPPPRLARFALAAWLAYDFALIAAFVAAGGRSLVDMVALAAIGCALVNVLRRPIPIAARADLPALAACALALGLMTAAIAAAGAPYRPTALSGAVELAASLLLLWGTLALGRSYAVLPAAIGCATAGPYAFVRHPIYGSYLLFTLALALSYPHPLVIGAAVLEAAALRWRALLEERLLRAALPEYRLYCDRVRHRFLPGIA